MITHTVHKHDDNPVKQPVRQSTNRRIIDYRRVVTSPEQELSVIVSWALVDADPQHEGLPALQ